MTEEQWLSCADPIAMMEFLRGSPFPEDSVIWWNSGWRLDEPAKGKDRKLRLFGCACCRRIWDRIPEPCNRAAVAAVEEHLEGRLSAPALRAALVASSAVEWNEDGSGRRSEPGYWAVKYLGRGFYKMTAAASALVVASKVIFMADEDYRREAAYDFGVSFYTAAGVFLRPFRWPTPAPAVVQAECGALAGLLRCLFGNRFRPPCLETAWLAWNDGAVRRLAEAIYRERAFERMPLLADALEEAGCANPEVLGHCRSGGEHVRGCWVVDLLQGRP